MTESVTPFGLYRNNELIGLGFTCPACSEETHFIPEDKEEVTCMNCGEKFLVEKQSD